MLLRIFLVFLVLACKQKLRDETNVHPQKLPFVPNTSPSSPSQGGVLLVDYKEDKKTDEIRVHISELSNFSISAEMC